MFERLERRVSERTQHVAARVRTRVAERARELPGVEAEESAVGVVLMGRRLWERALTDARLRWIAGWIR